MIKKNSVFTEILFICCTPKTTFLWGKPKRVNKIQSFLSIQRLKISLSLSRKQLGHRPWLIVKQMLLINTRCVLQIRYTSKPNDHINLNTRPRNCKAFSSRKKFLILPLHAFRSKVEINPIGQSHSKLPSTFIHSPYGPHKVSSCKQSSLSAIFLNVILKM